MTPNTTHTSGAADLRTAAQAVVDRWDTPLWKDVPATAEYIGRLRAALAAGQATAAPAQPAAQQSADYAALPTSNYAGRVHEEGFLIGTCPLYTADQMRAFADATHMLRASHGQAYPTIGDLCARIKAADDAAADRDYMLDSNDCIAVLRGEWKGPLTMDKPERASHGQAPAGANENAKLVTLIAKCRDAFPIPAHGDPIENYWSAAIEDPANVPAYLQEIAKRKQADSVQEDAARLDFLIEQRAYVVSDPDACPGHWLHWARPDGRTWVQGDEHPTPRAAIDAARKQGGA